MKIKSITSIIFYLLIVPSCFIANAQTEENLDSSEIEETEIEVLPEDSEQTQPKTAVSFDRQVIANLEAQHQRLIKALGEEDAFSLTLAELYAEYGSMLLRAGRYQEANEVYTQAVHIQKVNHGIYSPEQLYFLSELFQTAIGIGDEELVEIYLKRAAAIEERNGGFLSLHLDEMYVRAGHYYLDRYYVPTRRYKTKLDFLKQARSYFDHILTRYRNKPINDASLPYGELLLVTYLESTILKEMPIIFDGESERFNVSTLSSSPRQSMELDRDYRYVKGAYNRGFRYFNSYIDRAKQEGNDQEVANALLSWADTLLLFNRKREATRYYKMAWEKSQEMLSSEQLTDMFDEPQRIPAYSYLLDRNDSLVSQNMVNVPLTLSVNSDGSVSNIESLKSNENPDEYLRTAQKEAGRLQFRPMLIDGNATAVEAFPYEVKVVAN